MEGLIPLDLARRFGIHPDAYRLELYRQGNFTLALLLNHEDRSVESFGVAKRSVTDIERPSDGNRLALARALRRLR